MRVPRTKLNGDRNVGKQQRYQASRKCHVFWKGRLAFILLEGFINCTAEDFKHIEDNDSWIALKIPQLEGRAAASDDFHFQIISVGLELMIIFIID